MRKYFIHNGENELGPFDQEQLKLQGLKKETPIWYEGLESWTTAGEIEELKSLFPVTPPPLIKITEPTVATPPIMSQPQQSYQSYEEAFPSKKNFSPSKLIIAGVVLASCVIGWLLYQNSLNAKTLTNLQDQVYSQDSTITVEADKESNRQRINIANTKKNMNYRNNWYKYISATNSSYSYGALGGISGLEVVISNNTEYMLDEVEVQVGYVQDNGEFFKTEDVIITNIQAKSTKAQKAPDSNRGKTVQINIMGIYSKKMHFCYAPGNWANNSQDPYFCK